MRELSELLTGDRRTIQLKQIPALYKDKINELEQLLRNWHETKENTRDNNLSEAYANKSKEIADMVKDHPLMGPSMKAHAEKMRTKAAPDPALIYKLKEIAQAPSKGAMSLYQQVEGYKHIYVNDKGYRVDTNKGIKGRPTQFFYCDTLDEAFECLNNLI